MTLLIALTTCFLCVSSEEITIDSCANRQQQNATFTHDGENTLHIRKLNDILEFSCTIQVKSQSDSQINTVIVHADELNMPLSWLFNDKSLMVEAQAGRSLQIVYSHVNRFILDVGGTDNSVQFIVGALATETIINFPNNTLDETRNTLSVVGGKQGVLATGTIKEVRIGIYESNSLPFEYFNSVLGLSGDIGRVIIDTGSTTAAPEQNYVLGKYCLYEKHRGENETVAASDWLQGMIKNSGLVYSNCSVIYNPDADQSLIIRTGGSNDTVEALNFGMKTTLVLAEGSDNVTWLYPTEKATLNVDLGIGADTILIHEAAAVSLTLGDDQLTDTVTVMYDEVPPAINANTVDPIGSYNDSTLTITNWYSNDVLFVRRGPVKSTTPVDKIQIYASVPGSFIYYEMSDNTTFTTVECATDANIIYDTHSAADTSYFAQNTRVELGIAQSSMPCHVSVLGTENSNTTAVLLVPENHVDIDNDVELYSREEPSFTGFSVVGSMELRTEEVDHFEYRMLKAPIQSGTVTVNGIPAKTDLLLLMDPDASWAVHVNSIKGNVAIVDSTTVVSKTAFSSGNTVLFIGTKKESDIEITVPDSVSDIQLVNGCLNIKGNITNNTLTQWMVGSLQQIGIDVDPVRSCLVDMENVSSLGINNVDHIDVSDLRESNIDSVTVDSEKSLSVTIEPTELADPTRKWSSVALYNKGGLVHAEYLNSSESFRLYAGSYGRADITLGSPMLEDRSRIIVHCTNVTDVPGFYNWNFSALPVTDRDIRVYVNTSLSDLCSGSFTNSVNENQKIMPFMRFDEGMEVNVHTELSNSSSASDDIIRGVFLSTRSTSRDHYVHGHYSIAPLDDLTQPYMEFDWDVSATGTLEIFVKDSVMTSFNISSEVTAFQPYWIYFKGESRLSFPDHKDSVFFRRSVTTKFLYDKRLISLKRRDLPSDTSSSSKGFDSFKPLGEFDMNNEFESLFSSSDFDDGDDDRDSMGHCFNPCSDCSAGYWGEVHLSDRPCETRLGRTVCNETARIYLTQLDQRSVLGCGSPDWDNHTNGTCSFVLNDEGVDLNIIYPPQWVQIVVIVVISLSAFMTITGTTSTLGRAVWKHRRVSGLTAWWARSVFRDLLADQFSWAGIVITASLAEVRDYDYTQWGGPVVAILQMTKHYVLDWFLPCDTCGEPLSVSPPLIVFWLATALSILVRVIFVLLEHYKKTLSNAKENALLILQALLTSSGFILLPLVGYTLAFLDSESKAGYASLVLAIALFVSQPIGSFTVRCLVGVFSSLCVVILPVLLAFISGLGAPRSAFISLSILSVIILPFTDMAVLWTSFFRNAVYRSSTWRRCLGATIGLRAASAVCGLVFFIMLAFDLDDTASTVAAVFWFAWIIVPWFGLITLTLPVPGVLSRPNRRQKTNEDVSRGEAMQLVNKRVGDSEDVALVRKGVHRIAVIDGDEDL